MSEAVRQSVDGALAFSALDALVRLYNDPERQKLNERGSSPLLEAVQAAESLLRRHSDFPGMRVDAISTPAAESKARTECLRHLAENELAAVIGIAYEAEVIAPGSGLAPIDKDDEHRSGDVLFSLQILVHARPDQVALDSSVVTPCVTDSLREYGRASLAVSAAVAQRRETANQLRARLPEMLAHGDVGLTPEQTAEVVNLAVGVAMLTSVYVNPPQVAPHLLEVLERPR